MKPTDKAVAMIMSEPKPEPWSEEKMERIANIPPICVFCGSEVTDYPGGCMVMCDKCGDDEMVSKQQVIGSLRELEEEYGHEYSERWTGDFVKAIPADQAIQAIEEL